MVGWHHRLDGHEFEQAPRVGDGLGTLVCCSPWGLKESDTTKLNQSYQKQQAEGIRIIMRLDHLMTTFYACHLCFSVQAWKRRTLLFHRCETEAQAQSRDLLEVIQLVQDSKSIITCSQGKSDVVVSLKPNDFG